MCKNCQLACNLASPPQHSRCHCTQKNFTYGHKCIEPTLSYIRTICFVCQNPLCCFCSTCYQKIRRQSRASRSPNSAIARHYVR
ncbi:unnamed protein product [Macrosiphum euphorbiae]|uniref:Uncharacterized protein n=1 Tax=Macrosiphum euphorbiae TaxID=13131 RepID=A0AAV0WNA6_9HEMI|nr:unnamed protein product [Macrosiphum euphorbiae]